MSAYLPPSSEDCPTFVDDSDWHPLIDGATYFAALDEALRDLGPGDAVLIAGLSVDPGVDLRDRDPSDPEYEPLVERLGAAADRGAQVRVLLAGRVFAASLPIGGLSDFRVNVNRAQRMRAWAPSGSTRTPLAGSVIVDFAGALFGSNHAKSVVVSRDGELTAFVGGIDLEPDRYDATPHDSLRHDGERWGWHDMAVRLRGPAAEQVWHALAARWTEARTLPKKRYVRRPLHFDPINPGPFEPTPPAPPDQKPLPALDTSVRVLRSLSGRKFTSVFPGRSIDWDILPRRGYQEVFETLTTAIAAARRFVYLEDQYLGEEAGGRRRYELYPALHDAVMRGVKVILVGSGIRDPEDPGIHLRPINRGLNRDLRTKIADLLDAAHRSHFAVWRVEHATVHAKLVLVDDVFACIGSANVFSRSMGGVDNELSAAVETSTSLVRDLRVRVWAEHLRTPLTEGVRTGLEDLDLALGIWDQRWLPPSSSPDTWREPGTPAGFAPAERVLARVDD